LIGAGRLIEVVIRVTPAANSEEPIYLLRQFPVPEIPQQAEGEGEFTGGFDLGAGRYHVDWMMRDSRGRVCSSHWEADALLPASMQGAPLTLRPNTAAAPIEGLFDEEPRAERPTGEPLRVKILLNLSPADPGASVLSLEEEKALVSILRGVARQPRVGSISLVAFNLREQKIVDRQESTRTIDFGELSRALQSRTAGTMDYHLLQDPQSETRFATQLLTEQLGSAAAAADAVIIVGAKVNLEKRIPHGPLKEAGTIACPIFYLNYNSNPFENPWRDTIGSALKAYRNGVAYNILLPRDFASAMSDIIARMNKAEVSAGL
jgi:hypothetical protein